MGVQHGAATLRSEVVGFTASRASRSALTLPTTISTTEAPHMDQLLPPRMTIALVAHDHCKPDLLEWAEYNRAALVQHDLVATGTTGGMLRHELGIEVRCLKSGPLGGDLQIGAMLADGDVDLLIFFWDPLQPQPHDPDVKALLRMATLQNIPAACNRATADFLISSPLASSDYHRTRPAHETGEDHEAEEEQDLHPVG